MYFSKVFHRFKLNFLRNFWIYFYFIICFYLLYFHLDSYCPLYKWRIKKNQDEKWLVDWVCLWRPITNKRDISMKGGGDLYQCLFKGTKHIFTKGNPRFGKNLRKIWTIRPTGVIGFEPSTSRLRFLKAESFGYWWCQDDKWINLFFPL